VAKPVKAEKLEEPKTVAPKAEAPQVDSPKKNEQKVAPKKDVQVRKEETKPAKPMRPSTHVLQRGESLTRISQKYYGTKDSVRAILRVNKFNDPDNLPVGAVVKLP
jgi:nucleoid-associated protein YgaU